MPVVVALNYDTQLYIARKVEELEKIRSRKNIEETKIISAMLYNLIKVRRDRF